MEGFKPGQNVWVKGTAEWVWERGEVRLVQGDKVLVESESGKQLLTNLAYPVNPVSEAGFHDLSAMPYLNEATILSNLHRRSNTNRPYTFLGGAVMVAVNPVKRIHDPSAVAGDPKMISRPHPFAMAEMAYQQLKFGIAQRKRHVRMGGKAEDFDTPVSQTVVVGGESGAGKTESSKMVLGHLVKRCGGGELDKRLLGTNPILESFGNAGTLRNDNSSRFGKLMKLHFDADGTAIMGASVATYLLERSRVTTHESGERGYHLFYQLLAASSKDKAMTLKTPMMQSEGLGLSSKNTYRYLAAGAAIEPSLATISDKPEMRPEDGKRFMDMRKALADIGLTDPEVETIFRTAAAVLHLGNIDFHDDDRPEGFVAQVSQTATSLDALDHAIRLLGFESADDFGHLFTERSIQSGNAAAITVFNEAAQAREACDAVARALYSRLFNYILQLINGSIQHNVMADKGDVLVKPAVQDVIGVLDIFGFESFAHNDFEQLLINYTNESLQATFNEQVFHAEAELYRREQLVLSDDDEVAVPKRNSVCMELLEGVAGTKTPGILQIIDQQSKMPSPSDFKLNDKLHESFGRKQNKAFGKVHPKDIDRNFVVIHYAGAVRYTVGSFLIKNSDQLPKEVNEFFKTTTLEPILDIWHCTGAAAGAGAKKGGRNAHNASIVSKFRKQIMELKDDLDSTRCSFIRCIKPNPFLVREDSTWFNRRYVTGQLKALSILQTAEVLKNGFPTRVAYDDLTETYAEVLPDRALHKWRTIGAGSVHAFVTALFWAFDIPSDAYKLGLTKVFFKSGKLAELDEILNVASLWADGNGGPDADRVFERFEHFFMRRRWRVVFAKMLAFKVFSEKLGRAQDRDFAAARIQTWWHAAHERKVYWSAVRLQALVRRRQAKRRYRKMVKEAEQEAIRREAELAERLERERKEQEEARKRADEARRERERLEKEEAKRAKEKADAEKRRKALEKVEEMAAQMADKMKKNRPNFEARLAKRIEHLESMSAFNPFDGDEDEDEEEDEELDAEEDLEEDAEAEAESPEAGSRRSRKSSRISRASSKRSVKSATRRRVRTHSVGLADLNARMARLKRRELERQQELEDAEESYQMNRQRLLDAEEAERAKALEREESIKRAEEEQESLRKMRRENRKRMEARLAKQHAALDDADKDFVENPERSRRALSSRKHAHALQSVLRNRQNRKGKKERRVPARKSYLHPEGQPNRILREADFKMEMDAESDAESESDFIYGQAAMQDMAEEHTTYKATGWKLPVRGSSFPSFGRRWKHRAFTYDPKEQCITYMTPNKAAKVKDRFMLNGKSHKFPTIVYENPRKYQEKEHVLLVKNGYLHIDHDSADPAKRQRELVIAFESESGFLQWKEALSEFVPKHRSMTVVSKHQSRALGRLASGKFSPVGRPMDHLDKINSKLTPEQREEVVEVEQEVREYIATDSLLESKGFSPEERERLLETQEIVRKDKKGRVILSEEEEDESSAVDGYIAVKCRNCNRVQTIHYEANSCPSCDHPLIVTSD